MTTFRINKISKWNQDLLHLIYPNQCLICENELTRHQKSICNLCFSNLNFTYFEAYEEPTPLDQLFWGRVAVHGTYAYLYFEKNKGVQPVLHALKYKDRPEIGIEMGSQIGNKIKLLPVFSDLDALIPIPLHPRKKFIRGYNQSEKLAEGIASVINVPVDVDFISRTKYGKSQTTKGRFLRWDNIQGKFNFSPEGRKKHMHIALVDDVITTGATLETIIRLIHENNPEIRISILSLALTK